MPKCDAGIRPLSDDTEIRCHLIHMHTAHEGELRDRAYPGSITKLTWMEDDRRNFHGEYPGLCDKENGCRLPKGHQRKCFVE